MGPSGQSNWIHTTASRLKVSLTGGQVTPEGPQRRERGGARIVPGSGEITSRSLAVSQTPGGRRGRGIRIYPQPCHWWGGGARGRKKGPGPQEGTGDGPVPSHSQGERGRGGLLQATRFQGYRRDQKGIKRHRKERETHRREKEDRDVGEDGGSPRRSNSLLYSLPGSPLDAFLSVGADQGGGQGRGPIQLSRAARSPQEPC